MLDLNSVRPVGAGFPRPTGRDEATSPHAANRRSVSWIWPASWLTRTPSPATPTRDWVWASAWARRGSPSVASARGNRRGARLIDKTVTAIQPFSYMGLAGELPRGKIELDTFEEIKAEVAALAAKGAAETGGSGHGVSALS